MKRISWDERYVALNIYAKTSVVVGAGMLSGAVLASIFAVCFFPMMNSIVHLKQVYLVSYAVSAVALSLAGLIASLAVRDKTKENWETLGVFNYDEPYTFFVFFAGLAVAGYASLSMMAMYHIHIMSYIWWFPLVIALMLAAFVAHMWRVIQEKIMTWLFPLNPTFLVNEKRFKDQLKLKLSEAKRYGGPFAVLAISIDHKDDLIRQYGKKGWNRLNQEVERLFNMNTRETDVFGQIEDGTIIISLTHTDRHGAEIVARRVAKHVRDRLFVVCKQDVKISLSAGVGLFSERLTSVEDLTLAAISAVNRATSHEGSKIVYNDGDYVEDSLGDDE